MNGDSPSSESPCFVFAGGATGGHLMPSLAIAERLRTLSPSSPILFLCSDKSLDREILEEAGVPHHGIAARPFALQPAGLLRFGVGWIKARGTARQALVRLAERQRSRLLHVVAMGGYVAAPTARAAASLRGRLPIRVTLVNLDVVPGKANRLTAKFADEIISAVHTPLHPEFSQTVIGLPIRSRALNGDSPAACRSRLGLEPDRLTLLATGASQGAATLNQLMMDLAEARPQAFARWQVLHLTGPQRESGVAEHYRGLGVRAVVRPFLSQMADAWGAADLAVSRAGASSVAEAAANGVPTLFIPFPWHKDQHQRANAQALVDAGKAWLAEDRITPLENLRETIGPALLGLLNDDEARRRAREALAADPPPDAAERIALRLLRATE